MDKIAGRKGNEMKNYTHVIANFLVNRMNEYRMYSESEKIVITYGIEIIFNNILKVMIYLTVGFVCKIGRAHV